MSSSIPLDSALFVQQLKGMDLAKGVPGAKGELQGKVSKDGVDFSQVLNKEVEVQGSKDVEKSPEASKAEEHADNDTEVESKPTDGADPDQDNSSEDDSELASVTIQNPIMQAVVQNVVQKEVADEGKMTAPLMVADVKAGVKADALASAESKVVQPETLTQELSAQNANELSAEKVPEAVIAAKPLAVTQDGQKPETKKSLEQSPTVEPTDGKSLVNPKEASVQSIHRALKEDFHHGSHEQSKSFGENEKEATKSIDLKNFADGLFIQKNLLNVEQPRFDDQLTKLQGTEASTHLRPQIMREIEPLMTKVMLTNTGGDMTIQLKPGHLGNLKVDVHVDGDLVKVNFQAESPATRSALQAQVQDLKQSMNVAGLKVDQVQIGTLMAQENSRNGNSHQQQQQSQSQYGERQQQQHQREQQHAARGSFDQELLEVNV